MKISLFSSFPLVGPSLLHSFRPLTLLATDDGQNGNPLFGKLIIDYVRLQYTIIIMIIILYIVIIVLLLSILILISQRGP